MPRILITRAPHQASELADHLRALGAEPILIPTIEITEPKSFEELDDAIGQLDTFDWTIFTSANAVSVFQHRFIQNFGALVGDGVLFPSGFTKIAAIGGATARALATFGVTPDLIPPQAVAESLAEALLPHAKQPDGAATRFLLLRAEVARDHLPNTLRAAGAEVTIAPAYRTVIPEASIEKIRSLFSTHPPDAITFTSGSTATNLFALLEAANLTLPQQIIRASIGPITSQILTDAGYPPHMEATAPATQTFAAELMQYLQRS